MNGILRRACGLAILLSGGAAVAQAPPAPPYEAAKDPACIATVENHCALRCERRTMQLVVQANGEITLILVGADPASAISIAVQQDLLSKTTSGAISPDDAMGIMSDLSGTDGAVFTVPDFAQLKIELGFPPQQEFAPGDWLDLVRADLQRVLGVGVRTATYLATRIDTVGDPAVAEAPPSLEAAVQTSDSLTPNRN